jgi:hypothetical protein
MQRNVATYGVFGFSASLSLLAGAWWAENMVGKSSKEQGEHLRRTCVDFAKTIITGCSASLAWFGWTASVLTLGLAAIVLYRTCFASVDQDVLANAFIRMYRESSVHVRYCLS